MNSNAKEWGVTLLRLWMGFLIASTGYRMFEGGLGFSTLIELKSASLDTWASLAVTAIFSLGGAAIFLGIAFRLTAFFTSVAAAYFLWERIGTNIRSILDYEVHATILVVSVVFILLGPGHLNAGALFRKGK